MESRIHFAYPQYAASSDGSITCTDGASAQVVAGKVQLYGGSMEIAADRFICGAWHGPSATPSAKVVHVDGDLCNNRADNLRWQAGSGEGDLFSGCCDGCGEWFCYFKVGVRPRRYCSDRCWTHRRGVSERLFTCRNCGIEFLSERKRQYCSKECQLELSRLTSGSIYPCAACGVEYWREYSKKTKTCSPECGRMIREFGRSVMVAGECARCGEQYRRRIRSDAGTLSRFCSTLCAKRDGWASGNGSLKRRRKAEQSGDKIRLSELAVRDSFACGICSERVEIVQSWPHPDSPSIDHVIPLSAGGTHTWGNVQLTHLGCNLKKGAKCTNDPVLQFTAADTIQK